MEFRVKNKKANFLNEKTPDLDTFRQVQHSKELTLRRQNKYTIFEKNRGNKIDFFYEKLEQDIIDKYKSIPKFKFLNEEDLSKICFETEFEQCVDTLLHSHNEEEVLICLVYLRKIFLFSNVNSNINKSKNLIPQLFTLLKQISNSLIIIEIVWILSIFATKSNDLSIVILDKEYMKVISNLLQGPLTSMVFDHICWLIGNLSVQKDNKIMKELNVFSTILNIFPNFRSEKIEITLLWCFYSLSNAKLYEKEERFELKLIKTLSKLYNSHSNQEKLFILAILAEISNFSESPLPFILKYFSQILAINFSRVTDNQQEIDISKLTLIILGNITTGNNMFIDQMLDKIDNFLKTLKSIINVRTEVMILKEVFFILSNLAAGDENYVEMLFQENFYEDLFDNNFPYKINLETIWVIANMTNTNKEKNIITLLNVGFLKKIENFLDLKYDKRINILCLEALENLLNKVKTIEFKTIPDIYQKLIRYIKYQSDILDKIECIPEDDPIKRITSKLISYINEEELV